MINESVRAVLLSVWVVLQTGICNGQQTGTTVIDADVVIYGGTSAGVVAAIKVVRSGKTAVLIEPGRHLGGLTSGGLGWTDSGDKNMIGGISREFYQRIKRHYDQSSAWVHEGQSDYDRYRRSDDAMWTFEPKVAEATYQQMLSETNVRVIFGERLQRSSGVAVKDHRIASIRMESGVVFTGRQFIDATYEGDLMAAAGVTYTVGRESNEKYGETLNGNQPRLNTHNHRFVKNVDPYNTPGDPASGLLPEIEDASAGGDGTSDNRVQAYCYRMCMSNVPANRLPFPKPENYNERRYELLLRNFEAGDLRFPMKPDMMPNGKTDTNNNCAFSTDYLGGNYGYPDGSYSEREAIVRDHENYQKGLMWTLANHPRVPKVIRDEMATWGLPADEFADNGHWPHQLYIREARRMVSDYVVTELDCRRIRLVDDAVGIGSYNMDSHNVRRFVTADGFAQNEGDVQVSPGGPYLISYRSIIPAQTEVANLTVPVCLSSSHIAYGSIRMEPVFMILGQSAATAAVMAIDQNSSLQALPPADLRAQLLKDGQVLELPKNIPVRQSVSKASLKGLVLDDHEAELVGIWATGSTVSPFVGTGYLHDSNEGKGTKSATFRITIPKSGRYEVRFGYTANPNRATNVPVHVTHAGGTADIVVNQRRVPPIDQLFVSLGIYEFNTETAALIEVSTAGTNGHVIIDSVQIVE